MCYLRLSQVCKATIFIIFKIANKLNAVSVLHLEGKRQADIVCLLGVRKDVVLKSSRQFKKLGHEVDHSREQRKQTVNTPRNWQVVKQRISRSSWVPTRKIARETGISNRSVRRMARQEHRLRPTRSEMFSSWWMKTLAYDCNDIARSLAGPQVSSWSRSFSQMRN